MSYHTISPIAVEYVVAPNTSVSNILDEMRSLLSESEKIFNANAEAIDKFPGGWPALYAIRQCHGLLDALEDRLPPAEVLEAMRGRAA